MPSHVYWLGWHIHSKWRHFTFLVKSHCEKPCKHWPHNNLKKGKVGLEHSISHTEQHLRKVLNLLYGEKHQTCRCLTWLQRAKSKSVVLIGIYQALVELERPNPLIVQNKLEISQTSSGVEPSWEVKEYGAWGMGTCTLKAKGKPKTKEMGTGHTKWKQTHQETTWYMKTCKSHFGIPTRHKQARQINEHTNRAFWGVDDSSYSISKWK